VLSFALLKPARKKVLFKGKVKALNYNSIIKPAPWKG
jgi:hypothetical protein